MFSGRPALNGVGFFCAWVFCSMRMVCALLCGWAGFVDLKDRVLVSFAGGLLGVYEARCGWGKLCCRLVSLIAEFSSLGMKIIGALWLAARGYMISE